MRKTQVLGVAALMLVVGVGASCGAYAEESVRTSDVLRNEAQEALAKPGSSLSDKYPGLDKYLSDLTNSYDGSSEATVALQEATEAVNLLKGANVASRPKVAAQEQDTQNAQNIPSTNRIVVSSNAVTEGERISQIEQAQEAREAKNVAANIAVRVEEKSAVQAVEQLQSSETEEEGKVSEKETQAVDDLGESDAVELPKTGEEVRTASVGQLILAGIAVTIMTVLGVVMVLKSKKNI